MKKYISLFLLLFSDLYNFMLGFWLVFTTISLTPNHYHSSIAFNDLDSKKDNIFGAQGRTRTGTRKISTDFKSVASTNSATRAQKLRQGSESNRRPRLCRPLHNHSATLPNKTIRLYIFYIENN